MITSMNLKNWLVMLGRHLDKGYINWQRDGHNHYTSMNKQISV